MDELTPHLERFDSYESARERFQWQMPERVNLAEAICRRHNDAVTRPAVVEARPAGFNTYTFGAIDYLSDKFANSLGQSGIGEGDAVAVILPQSAALAVAHFGALKLGAMAVPLATSAEPPLIQYALKDSGAKAVVIDEASFDRLKEIISSRLGLQAVFLDADCREVSGDVRDFWREVYSASPDFTAVETSARSPAFIFYTSNSSGKPVGVAHSHGSAIGELPTFEMCSGLPVSGRGTHWLMTDWANPNSLLRVLYPAWWYGRAVVASKDENFGACEALRLIEASRVTDLFLPRESLEAIVEASIESRLDLKLETIVTDSPALSEKTGEIVKEKFGASLNGFIAAQEASIGVMKCDDWFSPRFGSMGKPAPGRFIEIIDDSGNLLPAGVRGSVAAHSSDAALFLEYRSDREKTDSAFLGEWFKTGLAGYKDEDGYVWPAPSSL